MLYAYYLLTHTTKMSPNYLSALFLSIFLIFQMYLFTPTVSDNTTSSPVSATTICKSTPYPSFCRTVLPTNNSSANVYDYGRFSFKKSISSAKKFILLVNKYLHKSSSLTPSALAALRDCQFLAQLNYDFLLSSSQVTNSNSLPTSDADDVQTMLSAILTNTQTCLDGLQMTAGSWSMKNGVYAPLGNNTKLYSVSLALFTKGWVKKKNKKKGMWSTGGKKFALKDGQLPLNMSSHSKAIFETVGKRKLLQTETDDGDQVNISEVVIVSQDGTQNFTTISDAVAAAPNNTDGSNGYFLIYVTEGVYEEYVVIAKNKKYLMMMGDGINRTVITGNHSYVDGWSTFNSSTFAVVGLGFVAVDMTFRNTADAIKHQAVAVRNGADLSTFYLCSFEAYQDTLYVHSLRQFYRECDIYGTVDFIFGNAAVVFQNCNMYPRLPMEIQFNAITAQGRTDPNQNTGISIHNCTIRAADDLASSNGTTMTYLGRPWKLYSRTIYMQSYIDSVVNPAGWREWDGDFALNTTYYAEYNNTGPGSNTTGRVNWIGYHIINSTEAVNFTATNFLMADDWVPQIGIPYYSGLL